VVVLSSHPFHGVLRKVMMFVGPKYFDEGEEALRRALRDIASWPPPIPGKTLRFPLLGGTFTARLPDASLLSGELQLSSIDGRTRLRQNLSLSAINGSVSGLLWNGHLFADLDIFLAFQGVIQHLWALWEMMLLNQPLMVMAPSPGSCSSGVAGLVSLIAPLGYASDFRPYFTVQDPEFALHANAGGEGIPPGLPRCLGATNLHFLRALEGFPNVLSLGQRSNAFEPAGMIQMLQSSSLAGRGGLLRALSNRFRGPSALIAQEEEGLWAKYQPVCSPDPTLISCMSPIPEGCTTSRANQMASANSAAIRRHFAELTSSFLEPFTKFFNPVEAERKTGEESPDVAAAFHGPARLPRFEPNEFLAEIAVCGPPAMVRQRLGLRWIKVYHRFVESENFKKWFEQQAFAARARIRRAWLMEREVMDIEEVIPKLSEIQLVDCFATVEKQMYAELESHSVDDVQADRFHGIVIKLKRDLQVLYKALPPDLQRSILFNKRRASFMVASAEGEAHGEGGAGQGAQGEPDAGVEARGESLLRSSSV